ncbi:MAG: hypothetical protein ACLFR0_03305 [Alphaproteobacteria bacterium]
MGQLRNKNDLVFHAELTRLEHKEIERIFARLFSSEEGRKALSYLQMITFHRTLGPDSRDSELRALEGQRALVATILRLIDRGRNQSR